MSVLADLVAGTPTIDPVLDQEALRRGRVFRARIRYERLQSAWPDPTTEQRAAITSARNLLEVLERDENERKAEARALAGRHQ